MSYRELRNFCEIMRSLGYPRTISMENFRVPNFTLAAEIIFWLAKRLDPKADIPDNIEDEKARIIYIKKACEFFYSNIKVKLNPKKLYAADGHCVQELLKVADILYKAKRSVSLQNDYDYSQELDITSKKNDIDNAKNLSSEIVEIGLNVRNNIKYIYNLQLLDLLDKEKGLKISRESAINYLEDLAKNYDNNKGEEVEKKIMHILTGQEKALEKLDSRVAELKTKEKELTNIIQDKHAELERAEKRLESLQHAQGNMSEMSQYESELSALYRMYVEKIRNHDYLQSRVEKYQKLEELSKKNLKGIFEQNKQLEQIAIHDQNDIIDDGMGEDDEDEENKGVNQHDEEGGDGQEDGGDGEFGDEDDDERF